MSSKKGFEKEIQVPMSERVRLEDLKFDNSNPNRLSREGMERLKASIRKWGDIVPIVTNKDLLVAEARRREKSERNPPVRALKFFPELGVYVAVYEAVDNHVDRVKHRMR